MIYQRLFRSQKTAINAINYLKLFGIQIYGKFRYIVGAKILIILIDG